MDNFSEMAINLAEVSNKRLDQAVDDFRQMNILTCFFFQFNNVHFVMRERFGVSNSATGLNIR